MDFSHDSSQEASRREGLKQGAAQQKAEDDKLIAQITAQKDAEIARLKALLAQAQSK